MLWLALLLLSGDVVPRLVVKEDEVSSLTLERLRAEAELVGSSRRPHPACAGVEEDLLEYTFTVLGAAGEETEDTATIATVRDLTIDRKVVNVDEAWIWGIVCIRPYLNCFEQDDQYLLEQLQTTILRPPSTLPYNFSRSDRGELITGQFFQPIYLDTVIFKKQVRNGFFIEAGAADFETDSNTILFETQYGWSGLLVEPNPAIYSKGFSKQRKAWAAPSCLATQQKPHTVHFVRRLWEGAMAAISPEATEDSYEMQCFPLYSLLTAAAGADITVNYLSLDIEGAEFLVLQTIPWDKVDIEVLTVETEHAGEVFPGSREDIRQYLEDKGYVHVYNLAIDDVFVRRDLYEGKYAPDLEMQESLEASLDWTEAKEIIKQENENKEKRRRLKKEKEAIKNKFEREDAIKKMKEEL